jgi:hypothetical protein
MPPPETGPPNRLRDHPVALAFDIGRPVSVGLCQHQSSKRRGEIDDGTDIDGCLHQPLRLHPRSELELTLPCVELAWRPVRRCRPRATVDFVDLRGNSGGAAVARGAGCVWVAAVVSGAVGWVALSGETRRCGCQNVAVPCARMRSAPMCMLTQAHHAQPRSSALLTGRDRFVGL